MEGRRGNGRKEMYELDSIICVVGPTASGKTELALRLAETLSGEIVSCDSMQLYRRMDIGTAKPTPDELARARHHMIDVCEPDEAFSVGKYVQMADACVQDILSRGKTAIITGGTGLYADSLISGRTFAPVPQTGVRERLQARLAAEGGDALLRELACVDPVTAARLHPADEKRIVRALEVFLETGEPISRHNERTRQQPDQYEPVWLGLDFADRAALYERIDRRVDKMRAAGLEREVRELLASGVPAAATAMQAIGYKELAGALRGDCTFDEAYDLIKRRSRNYAKRQLTWFRRNSRMRWLIREAADDDASIFRAALQEIPFFAG